MASESSWPVAIRPAAQGKRRPVGCFVGARDTGALVDEMLNTVTIRPAQGSSQPGELNPGKRAVRLRPPVPLWLGQRRIRSARWGRGAGGAPLFSQGSTPLVGRS